MPYDPVLVQPMRDELTHIGVRELRSAADVDALMRDKTGTTMIVVNSVCGCAAGQARPGVRLALESAVRPDRVATVFAGQDLEATAQARSYFSQFPPSSPSIALFKDGQVVFADMCTKESAAAPVNGQGPSANGPMPPAANLPRIGTARRGLSWLDELMR